MKKEQQLKFETNNGGFIEIKNGEKEVVVSFNGPSESNGAIHTVSHIFDANDFYQLTKVICDINNELIANTYTDVLKELGKKKPQ